MSGFIDRYDEALARHMAGELSTRQFLRSVFAELDRRLAPLESLSIGWQREQQALIDLGVAGVDTALRPVLDALLADLAAGQAALAALQAGQVEAGNVVLDAIAGLAADDAQAAIGALASALDGKADAAATASALAGRQAQSARLDTIAALASEHFGLQWLLSSIGDTQARAALGLDITGIALGLAPSTYMRSSTSFGPLSDSIDWVQRRPNSGLIAVMLAPVRAAATLGSASNVHDLQMARHDGAAWAAVANTTARFGGVEVSGSGAANSISGHAIVAAQLADADKLGGAAGVRWRLRLEGRMVAAEADSITAYRTHALMIEVGQ